MNKIKNLKLNSKFFNLLFATIFSVFFYFTFLSAYLDGLVLYTLFLLWLLTSLFIDCSWLRKYKKIIFLIFFYMLIIFIEGAVSKSTEIIEVFLKSHIYSFVFMIMGLFYIHNFKKFNFKFFIKLIFFALLISYLATFIGLFKYPTASRDLASGLNPLCPMFKKIGIGGFAFIYQTPYLIILLFFAIHKNMKVSKVLMLVLFVMLLFITIVKSDYTTALIMVAAAILLSLYFIGNKSFKSKLLGMVIILFILFIFRIQLLEFVLNKILKDQESVIWIRLNELLTSLSEDLGDFNRIALMEKSLAAFFQNPWIGEFGQIPKTVGGHSDLIDIFGKYGFFIGVAYQLIFFLIAKAQYNELLTKKARKYYLLIQLIFIIGRATNDLLGAQNICGVVFFIAPIVLKHIEESFYNQELHISW